MWKPQVLGTVIAERKLKLRVRRATKRVVLRLGQPVRAPKPKRDDPWFCPFQIDGLGRPGHLYTIGGEDAIQALVLALDYCRKALPAMAARAGGKLSWVKGEADVISPQGELLEAYGRVAREAIGVVEDVERVLRDWRNEPTLRAAHHKLAALLRKYGDGRSPRWAPQNDQLQRRRSERVRRDGPRG